MNGEVQVGSVTVIIPAYNAARKIGNAIQSILKQDYPGPLEIIVVDDRSTDMTSAICNQLIATYPQIRCLPNQRAKGPSGARNTGLLAATTEYIAFLDADDVWFSDHLSTAIGCLDRNPDVGAVLNNFEVVEGAKTEDWHSTKRFPGALKCRRLDQDYRLIEDSLISALIEESFVHVPALVCRRDAVRLTLFNEAVRRSEDRDYAIQLRALWDVQFAYSNRVTGQYLRHPESLTTRSTDNAVATYEAHIRLFTRYLELFTPDRQAQLQPEDLTELRCKIQDSLEVTRGLLSYQYRLQGRFADAYSALRLRFKWDSTFFRGAAMIALSALGSIFRESESFVAQNVERYEDKTA